MFKLRANDKKEYQSKETCAEVVKRIDEKSEERHTTVTKTLERIEGLIRNNGKPQPR